MARPRKNIPQRQTQQDRRFTDKLFACFQQLVLKRKTDQVIEAVHKKTSWVEAQAKKIKSADVTQFSANLKVPVPEKLLSQHIVHKALYDFAQEMKDAPTLVMLAGYLLFLKIAEEDQSYLKIYNLNFAQVKLLTLNPQMLQAPFRLEVALGLSGEQMVVFEEESILTNPIE